VINGVTYVTTGGAGRGTRPVGLEDFSDYTQQVAHFVYVEADESMLWLVAIDATGVEFDSLMLEP
jgi:hypothetical protein